MGWGGFIRFAPVRMDSSSSASGGGLLNVGRRSIRRLAHVVKRKREAAVAESSDTLAAKAPTRNTASGEDKFNEINPSCRWRKGAAAKQEEAVKQEQIPKQEQVAKQKQAEPAGRGSGQQGTSARRKTRGKRPSLRGTNTTKTTPLMSWPFKRSHGKLNLQKLLSPNSRALQGRAARSKREIVVAKIKAAIITEASESSGRGNRKEGAPSANGDHRVFWKDAGGDGEDGAQRRAKKRRRRRKSLSDADFLHRAKAPKQIPVLTSGLCTPKRPRREEETRCKPKKLAVPKEEFLSLKKKLEWELTLNLYCRQKKEFMEINKGMYECDDCDAPAS